MLQLASVGPMVELSRRERDFRLSVGERILVGNIRFGVGSVPIYKVEREKKIVCPTDVRSMNTAEIPEGYCLSTEFIWAKTAAGEDLLFPGNYTYGLVGKSDLIDVCKAMNTSGEHKVYILDDEKPRTVYVVNRVTLSDDDAIDLASNFDQRFPIYGLRDGFLTRVIYQSEWLTGEDLAIWKIGIRNVIWSNIAKLLFHL